MYELILEEVAKLVEQHCCRACDGYNCQNGMNGRTPLEIAQDIVDLLKKGRDDE